MKQTRIIVLAIAMLIATGSLSAQAQTIKTRTDSISYAIGVNWGQMLLRDSLMLNLDALRSGINDALYQGGTKQMNLQQIQGVMASLTAELQERQQKTAMEAANKAKAEGEEFLAKNMKNKNVKTTQSGLQYEVIQAGSGPRPTENDTVEVHYKGTLISGKVFDSSIERGETVKFPLKNVIKGWTEGLQLMQKGAKYKFYIPSELAYGERGVGEDIGPNQTLIFEVELINIFPAAQK
ncbi:MAG: FKBP-type peptidyl-prolyl cis-trans isomerase [Chloroflexota bacterium]